MNLFPRFTNRRRALQLTKYALLHGTKVFEKFNRTNLFLARQFGGTEILCNVCGQRAKLWFEMHSTRQTREHRVGSLRETLECLNCLSRMRYRLVAHGILGEARQRFGIEAASIAELVERIGHVTILDTDAFSPITRILERNVSYRASSYVPGRPFGLLDDNKTYNIDLQAIGFPDATFDMILTTDVMEHVRDVERANREIFRCLKPGGAHIFTVPFANPRMLTRTLIDTSTPDDIYLDLPQLHGDDHFGSGIPAYRIYGWDFLDHLRDIGFEARTVRVSEGVNGIYDERYFVARRAA
jgi:SAM-dependent methyltransferase